MRPMALFACGRILVAGRQQLSVLAALILLSHFFMAAAAVHWTRDCFAWPHPRSVDFRMTLAAGDFCVSRTCNFLNLYEQIPAIRRFQVLIAVAAHAIGVRHALRVEHVADLVRLVAIDARRKYMRFLLPQLAADCLAVDFFDLGVALGASRRDIAPVDRRIRIGMGEDAVRRVAGRAIRGNNQSFLE